jgi:ComF family protein
LDGVAKMSLINHSKIDKIYNNILDIVFPKFCVGCGKEGVWICPKCQDKIILIKKPTCPKCMRLTKNGQFCDRCRSKSSLTGVVVAAYYGDGPLKELIHGFKYDGLFDIKEVLGKYLTLTLTEKFKKQAVLIPVPLHKKRLAERGYNQSHLLATEVAKSINYQVLDKKLIRKKYTNPQVTFSGANRKKNIRDAFYWIGEDEIDSKTIILVDDVYTTGATLEECAKVLRNAGAREIWGLVLAKV